MVFAAIGSASSSTYNSRLRGRAISLLLWTVSDTVASSPRISMSGETETSSISTFTSGSARVISTVAALSSRDWSTAAESRTATVWTPGSTSRSSTATVSVLV